jgi:hypothetical protein
MDVIFLLLLAGLAASTWGLLILSDRLLGRRT